jgi:hypothetical protein
MEHSRGARVAKKTHPVHLRTKADVFAFIGQERDTFGVTRLCQLFAVTWAGFCAWRDRPVSVRARQDRVLLEEMRAIFERSSGTYGSPRLNATRLTVSGALGMGDETFWRRRSPGVYKRCAEAGGSSPTDARSARGSRLAGMASRRPRLRSLFRSGSCAVRR